MRRRRFLQSAGVVAGAALAGPGFALAKDAVVAPDPPPWRAPDRRLSLDLGWRFHRGDIVPPMPTTGDDTYDSTKAGAARGAAGMKFDDAAWRVVDLPHDFVVEGPFDPKTNVAQGYRPKGVAWYRRSLRLDPADRGKHLELQ